MSDFDPAVPGRGHLVLAALRSVMPTRDSLLRLAALVCAALLPLAIRVLVLAEGGQELQPYDLDGAISDLALGLVVNTGLVALWRLHIVAFVVAFAAWFLPNVGYYEFMHEYGSPYFLIHARYVLDPEFVAGSGLSPTHPYLTGIAALLVIGLTGFAAQGLAPRFWIFLLLLAGYLGLINVLPSSSTASPWRMRDFVSVNVADVAGRVLWPDRFEEDLAAGRALLDPYLQPDLSGTPILSGRRGTNVVIVFIESIAGGQVPSLAAAHGIDPNLRMPLLSALASDALSYSTFITHQKQTNRGLYAALCGQIPRLVAGLAEMTQIAEGNGRACLPEALVEAGYDSLFLNSSGKSFQSKGEFMKKIGFQRALSSEDFDPTLWRGKWGVDDASLYSVALDDMEILRGQQKPYFVAIETSSTHHPFVTPGELPPDADPRHGAWAFADRAVTDFVAQMRERGYLDDTLVLITSDEASDVHEDGRFKDGTLAGFTENWGMMVALSPEARRGRIDRLFQQADIPLSVLDYLGLAANEKRFIGRSFFRTYKAARTVYSANIYKGLIYENVEGLSLTACNEMLQDCRRFDMTKDPIFSVHHAREDGVTPSHLMRAVRAWSVLGQNAAGP